jgi:hypothetical protein
MELTWPAYSTDTTGWFAVAPSHQAEAGPRGGRLGFQHGSTTEASHQAEAGPRGGRGYHLPGATQCTSVTLTDVRATVRKGLSISRLVLFVHPGASCVVKKGYPQRDSVGRDNQTTARENQPAHDDPTHQQDDDLRSKAPGVPGAFALCRDRGAIISQAGGFRASWGRWRVRRGAGRASQLP